MSRLHRFGRLSYGYSYAAPAPSPAPSPAPAPAPSGPVPVITQAYIDEPIQYSSIAGQTITLTELLDASGAVLASAAGPTLSATRPYGGVHIRQTYIDAGGSNTTATSKRAYVYMRPQTDWFFPAPVARDAGIALTSVNQPGTRIGYLSTSVGVGPDTPVFYWHDGANIIDSTGSTTGAGGVPYGTNPYNPTGPVIANEFWSAIGPCTGGNAPGIRVGDGGGAKINPGGTRFDPGGFTRFDKSDMWLFKRGDTFDLQADLAGYKAIATGWTATQLGLAVPGGPSGAQPVVVGAYGPTSAPRPVIKNIRDADGTAIVTVVDGQGFRNVLYTGLTFDGHGQQWASAAFGGNGLTETATHIRIQDCLFDGMGYGDLSVSESNTAKPQIELFRCIGVDVSSGYKSPTHISFGHSGGTDGSMTRFNQCLVARCGFAGVDPAVIEAPGATWPTWSDIAWPAGSIVRNPGDGELYLTARDVAAGSVFSVTELKGANTSGGAPIYGWRLISDMGGTRALGEGWSRNFYCDGPTELIDSLSLRGASGDQFRNGTNLLRTYFLAGYLNFGNGKSLADDDIFHGRIDDVVHHTFRQGSVHLGVGLTLSVGARNVTVNRLLQTGSPGEIVRGITFAAFGSSIDKIDKPVYARTRNITVSDSIINSGTGAAVSVFDGTRPNPSNASDIHPQTHAIGTYPWTTLNTVQNSKLISSAAGADMVYTPMTGALPTTDTQMLSNVRYTGLAEAATANGWTGTARNLKTYLQSQGITVATDDGVHEMVALLRQQRYGNWDARWTAKPLLNHIRTGWGMAALA